jgi:hypothetical protein
LLGSSPTPNLVVEVSIPPCPNKPQIVSSSPVENEDEDEDEDEGFNSDFVPKRPSRRTKKATKIVISDDEDVDSASEYANSEPNAQGIQMADSEDEVSPSDPDDSDASGGPKPKVKAGAKPKPKPKPKAKATGKSKNPKDDMDIDEAPSRGKGGKKRKSDVMASGDEDEDGDEDEKPRKKMKKETKPKISRAAADPWKLKSSSVKKNWKEMQAPPLEMFHFYRLVIDEYTYLDGKTHSLITNLQATCRWVLSGTPPVHDFPSLKTIAVFLDIHLGIDDDGEGQSAQIKKRRREQTGESFQYVLPGNLLSQLTQRSRNSTLSAKSAALNGMLTDTRLVKVS